MSHKGTHRYVSIKDFQLRATIVRFQIQILISNSSPSELKTPPLRAIEFPLNWSLEKIVPRAHLRVTRTPTPPRIPPFRFLTAYEAITGGDIVRRGVRVAAGQISETSQCLIRLHSHFLPCKLKPQNLTQLICVCRSRAVPLEKALRFFRSDPLGPLCHGEKSNYKNSPHSNRHKLRHARSYWYSGKREVNLAPHF